MRPLLDRLGMPEQAGLVLLVGFVVWAAVAAGLAGRLLSPTSPYVAAPVTLAVGVVLGAQVSKRADVRLVGVALLVISGVLLISSLWTGGPTKGGLGYANANAALAVQLIGLSGLAILKIDPAERVVPALAAAFALAAVVVNSSAAGFGVAVPLLAVVSAVAWHPPHRRGWGRAVAMACAAAIAAAATGIIFLAQRDPWPSWASAAFDPARRSLWHDAAMLWSSHRLTGGGPGTFEVVSALGHDPDTAAAHSSVLQIGAETGTVGVVLFGLIVLAGLLWAGRGSEAYGIVGAAAWTALLVHSFVDHLLDFPAIVIAAGMVIGWAGSRPRRSEELDVPEAKRPLRGRRG